MTPERWQQIERLYHEALEREAGQRASFLAEACAEDAALRREVESLLAFEPHTDEFIESSALELAARSLAEDQSESRIGQMIGPYRVLSLLGAGGMGEVYLAQDDRLNRKLALKLLPATFTFEEERARRFKQEARAASALNHPNILTVYEIGQASGTHFIATELIEGETLRQHLGRTKMSLREALKVALQVAEALSAAHAAGIVHRDIKPENIMLRRDGYIKVLDFGLAKLAEQLPAGLNPREGISTHASFHTEPGLVMGTFNYMSPEQARGQEVDGRTDIWSLGAVLYEMLAGRAPFERETPSDVMAAILQQPPSPPLGQLRPEVPVELERIVSKALEKERAHRYQTAEDLLLDLRKLEHQLEFEVDHERTGSTPSVGRKAETTGVLPSTQAANLPNRIASRWLIVAVALSLLVIVIGGVAYFRSGRENRTVDSVAILPFVNVGGDPNMEHLSEGLADHVINRLSQLTNLRVMSLNSVLRYNGPVVNAQVVGRELNVRAVLMGRIVQRGEELSISVELINAQDRSRIWGGQYNRRLADILAVQEEIARELTEHLRPKLTDTEQQRLTRRYTNNAEAYQLYLRGRYFWNRRSEEGFRRAIEYFNHAIALDPSYALAFAGLADCYSLLPNYSSTSPKEALPKAKAAALKALEIDDTLSEAHTSLGLVLKDYDWDFAGAEREFKRALELTPNYATAHHWRSENMVTLKRLDEALASMKRAQELDPFSLIINGEVGWVYYHARQPEQAVEQLLKTAEMDPNFARTYFFLGRAYEQKHMYEEARAATQKAIDLSGGYTLFKASLGHIYGMSGQTNEARIVLGELQERAKREYVSPVAFALVYTGLGSRDEAFGWLEKAYQQHDTILVYYLRDPQLEGLYSDPRFADLLRRVGMP